MFKHKTFHPLFIALWISVICFLFVGLLREVSAEPLKGEMLLFQDIPEVTSASHHRVSQLESPATASIITQEDIEHMGFLDVPSLLRYLSGVNYYEGVSNFPTAGIRGVNGMPPNNILVLIDGRPIYSPTRLTNQYAIIPETPEDIEKVEVVKGPGSVLYGSHAFSGVINVVTKKPEDINGVILSTGIGTFSKGRYNFTGGKRKGPWSYKFIGSWDQKNSIYDHENQDRRMMKFAGTLGYELSPSENFDLSFGIANGTMQVVHLQHFSPFKQSGIDGFLRGRYHLDDMKVDLWWRHHDTESDDLIVNHLLTWKYDNIDLLFSNNFKWKSHELVYGGEIRYGHLGAYTYQDWYDQIIYSFFMEDRWTLPYEFNIFTGLRYDNHSEAGGAFAPRLSIVKTFNGNQSIRFVVARAFKFPSYFDNYTYIPGGIFIRSGQKDIKPEKLQSFEVAWQMLNPTGLSLSSSVFYNRYEDKIDIECEWEGKYVYFLQDNIYDFDQYGFELEASYKFSHSWMVKANYSHVWNNKPEDMTGGPIPVNQLNGEIRYEHNSGLWADLRLHWQDRSAYTAGKYPSSEVMYCVINHIYELTKEEMQDILCHSEGWHYIDGYTLGDLSFGYKPENSPWSFTIGVHNVFHSRHEASQYHNLADTTVTGILKFYFD